MGDLSEVHEMDPPRAEWLPDAKHLVSFPQILHPWNGWADVSPAATTINTHHSLQTPPFKLAQTPLPPKWGGLDVGVLSMFDPPEVEVLCTT